jgi:DNA-binding MarR family transcriptional regulator
VGAVSATRDVAAPSADEHLWSALVTVYQMVLRDLVAALERDAGIDSGVYSALAYLERADPPGRLPLRALQERMHVRYSQPGLSRLVQRMEEDGLVERRRIRADGRAFTVVLTRSGRARFRRARDVYRAALHEHLGRHVGAGEATRVARMLEKIAATLGGGASPGYRARRP